MTKIQKHLRATGRTVQTWLAYIPVLLLSLVILAFIVGFLRQFLVALSRIDTAQVIALGVVYAMFAVLFKGAEESDRNGPAMDGRRGWVFSFLSSCFSGYSWLESSARNSRRSVRLTHRVPPIIVRDPGW